MLRLNGIVVLCSRLEDGVPANQLYIIVNSKLTIHLFMTQQFDEMRVPKKCFPYPVSPFIKRKLRVI
jgi:hypothetical protein